MNNPEAKFLLHAYRPNCRDALDPLFAESLAQAARDPALRAWLEREQAFDAAMVTKFNAIAPLSGLREAILVGAKASKPRRLWWTIPVWLAAAASVGLLFFTVRIRDLRPPAPEARDFALFAMAEVAQSLAQHTPERPEIAGLQARFTHAALPLPAHTTLDREELRRLGCRKVDFAGRETFEICFDHGGYLYHLYATAVEGLAPRAAGTAALVSSSGRFTATTWNDARFAYALVSADGADVLRRLL